MPTSEGSIQDAIRWALGDHPRLALWRNNVGVARHFDARTHRETVVRYGLAPGSADLIGCLNGVFVSLEVKTPTGRQSPEQAQWGRCVQRFGGHHAVVRSVEDAKAFVDAVEAKLRGAR